MSASKVVDGMPDIDSRLPKRKNHQHSMVRKIEKGFADFYSNNTQNFQTPCKDSLGQNKACLRRTNNIEDKKEETDFSRFVMSFHTGSPDRDHTKSLFQEKCDIVKSVGSTSKREIHREHDLRNDFTRFSQLADVESVFSPTMWKTLESRDLMKMKIENNRKSIPELPIGGNDDMDDQLKKQHAMHTSTRTRTKCRNVLQICDTKTAPSVTSLPWSIVGENCCVDESDTKIQLSLGLGAHPFEIPEVETARSSFSVFKWSQSEIPDHLFVALDCEMVGTGPNGKTSAVARCSILNYGGKTIFDKYIRPVEEITDYRTPWSGIKPVHMTTALPMMKALPVIQKYLQNKIIIGHAVYNDFRVLHINPKHHLVRDTAQCSYLVTMADLEGCGNSLRKLSSALLNREIQQGRQGHDSVEDARAALDLFKLVRSKWEPDLELKWKKKNVDMKQAVIDLLNSEKEITPSNLKECCDKSHKICDMKCILFGGETSEESQLNAFKVNADSNQPFKRAMTESNNSTWQVGNEYPTDNIKGMRKGKKRLRANSNDIYFHDVYWA